MFVQQKKEQLAKKEDRAYRKWKRKEAIMLGKPQDQIPALSESEEEGE